MALQTEHEVGNVRYLALPFLDEVLRRRLPPVPDTMGVTALRPIDPADGLLGDNESFAISSDADFTGDRSSASWLPSRTVAEKWREFATAVQVTATTGGVTVQQPPEAPTGLFVKRLSPQGDTIGWQAAVSWQRSR